MSLITNKDYLIFQMRESLCRTKDAVVQRVVQYPSEDSCEYLKNMPASTFLKQTKASNHSSFLSRSATTEQNSDRTESQLRRDSRSLRSRPFHHDSQEIYQKEVTQAALSCALSAALSCAPTTRNRSVSSAAVPVPPLSALSKLGGNPILARRNSATANSDLGQALKSALSHEDLNRAAKPSPPTVHLVPDALEGGHQPTYRLLTAALSVMKLTWKLLFLSSPTIQKVSRTFRPSLPVSRSKTLQSNCKLLKCSKNQLLPLKPSLSNASNQPPPLPQHCPKYSHRKQCPQKTLQLNTLDMYA